MIKRDSSMQHVIMSSIITVSSNQARTIVIITQSTHNDATTNKPQAHREIREWIIFINIIGTKRQNTMNDRNNISSLIGSLMLVSHLLHLTRLAYIAYISS